MYKNKDNNNVLNEDKKKNNNIITALIEMLSRHWDEGSDWLSNAQ
jgi:hypothetical protein